MLSDLYALETFYGSDSSAQFFSDLSQKYSREAVQSAITQGYLDMRPIMIGPDQGRYLLALTDEGRSAVLQKSSIPAG